MTAPSKTVYEKLTACERVSATIAALGREDASEGKKLVSTCPKTSYRSNDDAYVERMVHFMSDSLAVEADLCGLALDYLDIGDSEIPVARKILSRLASLAVAWERFVESHGISAADIKAAGAPRHAIVSALLDAAEGMENEEHVAKDLSDFAERFPCS